MALLRLPPELLQHTALLLCADEPLAAPWPVRTLLLVAHPLRAALDTNEFWAALYEQRFDSRAIQRRCFDPNAGDRADQLRLYCRLLRAIRIAVARNDRPVLRVPGEDGEEDCSTEALLFSAYLMMLENDGKNYAQLAAAGLPLFLDRFLRERLTDGQETNQGWPLDNGINGTALMLSWMFTTKGMHIFCFLMSLIACRETSLGDPTAARRIYLPLATLCFVHTTGTPLEFRKTWLTGAVCWRRGSAKPPRPAPSPQQPAPAATMHQQDCRRFSRLPALHLALHARLLLAPLG